MLQQELAHPPYAEFGNIDAIEDLENHVALVLYPCGRPRPALRRRLCSTSLDAATFAPHTSADPSSLPDHPAAPCPAPSELRPGEPAEFRDIAGALRRLGLGASAPLRRALADVSLERSTESRFGAIPHGLCDLGEAIAAPAQPLPGQCHPPPQ